MIYKTRIIAAIVVLGSLLGSVAAETPRLAQPGTEIKVDYAATRREIQSVEVILNDVINTMFASSPFALVQKPKGVYLPGYGITFSFLINIHLAVLKTPFGEVRQGVDVTPELKKKRIEELKDRLIKVLRNNGETLHQLRKEDFVTIVAFFEDRRFPDEPNENKTLVLTVQKKDLDELARKDDRMTEFMQRMRIIEY
jgi:hypothetical protein